MKTIHVFVEGSTPLLLNRPYGLEDASKSRRNAMAEDPDPRDVCEKCVYRNDEKTICLPGAAFSRMLREAGGGHKAKGSRKSLKYLIPASTMVMDDLVSLWQPDRKTPITNFEVDSRPVTIPATKGKIMRHRARLNKWVAELVLRINDKLIEEKLVRQIFGEGLEQIGLGDFRPEKGGPFGTGHIVAWGPIDREISSEMNP